MSAIVFVAHFDLDHGLLTNPSHWKHHTDGGEVDSLPVSSLAAGRSVRSSVGETNSRQCWTFTCTMSIAKGRGDDRGWIRQ